MRDGAFILTTEGRVRVEDLGPEHVVLTGSGRPRRILSTTRRSPDDNAVESVMLRAGSLGVSHPSETVELAGDDLVLIDHGIVAASHLVNGASIRRHPAADAPPRWDMMVEGFEDGTPEAYRPLFQANGFVHADLDIPDDVHRLPAPAATRRRLLAVATRLGHALTDDPDLHIEVDGVAIAARSARGNRYIFAVPERAETLRLVSRVWIPAEVMPESDDDRQLGVCVRRLVLDGHELDLGSLDTGWHKLEDHGAVLVRWTTGSAVVPLARPRYLDVELYGFRRYWVPASPEAAPLGAVSPEAAVQEAPPLEAAAPEAAPP